MNKTYRLLRYDWPLHFLLLMTNILPDNVIFLRLRGYLIRPFFKKCGKDFRVGRRNIFIDSFEMTVGNHVYIAYGNWFNATGGIVVEDEVIFGPNSLIVTSNHTRKSGSYRYGKSIVKPIKICYGSWIGGNCTILSGTTVGKGSVIAANSVALGEIPDNCIAAGNLAVVKKNIVDL